MSEVKPLDFKKKILILGFGSIGQAMLPFLLDYLEINPKQLSIIAKDAHGLAIAQEKGICFKQLAVTKENYRTILSELSKGDFLLNLSVGVSSVALINYCQSHGILYLDASTEPWEGGYTDATVPVDLRTNYALRASVLELKQEGPTAIITHGANPGLVSHFVKAALWNLAQTNEMRIPSPKNALQWAQLARDLEIKTIHISEMDSQVTEQNKKANEFLNTWSSEALIYEALQPAELGWGTHELEYPHDAHGYTFGSNSGIYLTQAGAETQVRTWSPGFGSFQGLLITHAESLSIADYLTIKKNGAVNYRPTVHYAYHPCSQAMLSIKELIERNYHPQEVQRVICSEIVDGVDELGVLLMGNKKGAYWYGSRLSIHEARALAKYNNATSMQVVSGILSGFIWAIENPNQGIVEPDELDYQFILKVAMPLLGTVGGYFTNWTPLVDSINHRRNSGSQDPWQFSNIRIHK